MNEAPEFDFCYQAFIFQHLEEIIYLRQKFSFMKIFVIDVSCVKILI